MKPSLSVITPSLNCAATLTATLESIRALGSEGVEHIVVDSGSTDGTVEMARRSGAEVMFWPPGNMYAAVNAGVQRSSGEWVTYINGDDVLYADAVRESLESMADQADVVYGNIDYIDGVGRFLFGWRSPAAGRIGMLLKYYSAVPQQGTLFRRSVFESLGGFDTRFRFSADYDFWVRARRAGFRFGKYSRLTMAGFRLSADQLSQRRRAEMAPEGELIRRELRADRSGSRILAERAGSSLYRWASNADSYMIRSIRGRGLDRRKG